MTVKDLISTWHHDDEYSCVFLFKQDGKDFIDTLKHGTPMVPYDIKSTLHYKGDAEVDRFLCEKDLYIKLK